MKNARFLRTICGAMLVTLCLTGCGGKKASSADPSTNPTGESNEQFTTPTTAESAESRRTFTMDDPAPYPVLNSIVDNPFGAFSDERNFLKIMEVGAEGTDRDAFGHYQDTMELEPGCSYSILVHVHNDADEELSEDGIAKGVGFTLSCPIVIDGDGDISVMITAENTTPLIIGDSVKLHSNKEVLITFADSEGSYPVRVYDYSMKNATDIATVRATDVDVSTITGEIGDLEPGYTAESGVYVYLWFSVTSAN